MTIFFLVLVGLQSLKKRRDNICKAFCNRLKCNTHRLNRLIPERRDVHYSLRNANVYPIPNGVARIVFGGGQFSVISGGRPDSVGGGGVVAENFRDRRKPGRFSRGGGSSRNFSASPITISQPHSVGGIFLGNRRSRSIKLPQFREFFFTFPGHLEITRN